MHGTGTEAVHLSVLRLLLGTKSKREIDDASFLAMNHG